MTARDQYGKPSFAFLSLRIAAGIRYQTQRAASSKTIRLTGRAWRANPLLRTLFGGWQTGSILTLQGGFPFSVGCQSNATYQNTDSTCRADAVGIPPKLSNPTPNDWFNLAAFVNRIGFVTGVGPYRFGNSGRNNVVGPGIVELDFLLAKSFRFTERAWSSARSSSTSPTTPSSASPAPPSAP